MILFKICSPFIIFAMLSYIITRGADYGLIVTYIHNLAREVCLGLWATTKKIQKKSNQKKIKIGAAT